LVGLWTRKNHSYKTEHSLEIDQGAVGFTGMFLVRYTVRETTVGSQWGSAAEPVFASTQEKFCRVSDTIGVESNAYHLFRPNPLPPPPPRFSFAIRSSS
jgi:hypothetical protein